VKYLLFAFSDCKDPAKIDEYNDWYDNMHMPDMLNTPGLVKASRWMSADNKDNEVRRYLAMYELETDDVEEFNKLMREQGMWTFQQGRFSSLPVFDPDNVPRIYKQITKEKKGTPWAAAKGFKPGNKDSKAPAKKAPAKKAAAKAPAKKAAAKKTTKK
jgi:hypothetical protein